MNNGERWFKVEVMGPGLSQRSFLRLLKFLFLSKYLEPLYSLKLETSLPNKIVSFL